MKAVAYVIHRVSQVDNKVDGVDVISLNDEGEVQAINQEFIQKLEIAQISDLNFDMNIEGNINDILNISEEEIPNNAG
ncbi:MAG: hypothetical protein ABEK59_10865 [Halobacteria archaeon]